MESRDRIEAVTRARDTQDGLEKKTRSPVDDQKASRGSEKEDRRPQAKNGETLAT